jgi:hypothetical protein
MFTLTDSLFYQHSRRDITVKIKHILPQIGEVEGEVDPYVEFQDAAGGSAGDPGEEIERT